MAAFNTYPVRFPRLQRALGLALGRCPTHALEAYVGSMELSTSSLCRTEVAVCLRAFREIASEERRRELWTPAFDRWREWDFGAGTEQPIFTGSPKASWTTRS